MTRPPECVLLLSALDPSAAPDRDLSQVLEDLSVALARGPRRRVEHREVGAIDDIARVVAEVSPDVVFNACETISGRTELEPAVPLELERLGVSFTGSTGACLARCLHKADSTRSLEQSGVLVPETFFVDAHFRPSVIPSAMYPMIVKPACEDGSVGIDDASVALDERALGEAIERLARQGFPAVAQRYVDGREVSVTLLGWPEPLVLPPGEILYDAEVFRGRMRVLTYASKWDAASGDYAGTPAVAAELPEPLAGLLASTARKAFDVLGMRDYGRVDFRVDSDGRPFVIDVNPNCDLSRDGGFMRAAARVRLSYADVVERILAGAVARASLTHDLVHVSSR